MKRTAIWIGNSEHKALRLPVYHPLFYEITRGQLMPTGRYLGNRDTVLAARSPDEENPLEVYLLRRTPSVTRGLQRDGYRALRDRPLDDKATILRRLKEI